MPEEPIIKQSLEKIEPREKEEKKEPLEKGPDLDLGKSLESLDKKSEKEQKEVSEQISSMAQGDDITTPAPTTLSMKEREKQIEKFLSGGLEEAYLKMTASEREEFRRVGEKTARDINSILTKAKVKTKKIIELIKKWLTLIPGVSRFFLEQEAKIRADKIMELKK